MPLATARLRRVAAQLALLIVAGLVTLAIDRIVRATPGGQTREMLSFAGTLRQNGQPLMGQQTLTFAFKKGGNQICAPTAMTTPDATTGAFTTQIDISSCPSTLFDGGDVVVDVSVGNNVVVTAQPVNAVPYAKYADRYGSPDCPVGYLRDPNAMGIILCKNGADEMVKVGTGATAFWIDRYEASLWQNPDGTGMQLGLQQDDAHNFGFLHNGQWTKAAYAVSKTGVSPAGYLTLYQMTEACRLSGKRLPIFDEWQVAARGTVDPGSSNGANGVCLTNGKLARNTGLGSSCVSVWGAQDMIGNVSEGMWWTSVSNATQPGGEYNQDYASPIQLGNMMRGGAYSETTTAGIFYGQSYYSPWVSSNDFLGFRCMIPR